MGQMSFWSADARPSVVGDLAGLLCGPGYVELFGRRSAARLTVVLGSRADPDVDAREGADAAAHGDADAEPGSDDPHDAASDRDADSEDADVPVDLHDPDDLAFLDLDPDELAARLVARTVGEPSGDHRRRSREPEPAAEPRPDRLPSPDAPADPVALWRARAVSCALRVRGMPTRIGRTDDGRPQVRTAYRHDLAELARRWTGGGPTKTLPPGFELDGPRLRLWVLAAGRRDGGSYLLGLDPDAPDTYDGLLTASRRAGLAAQLGGEPSAPTLRIARPRARGRLVELVGARPRSAHDAVWPV